MLESILSILPGFTGFNRVFLGFNESFWFLAFISPVILGFTWFHWVSLGFIGFYWVLLGFTGFLLG